MFDLKRPCNNCPFRIGQGECFRLSAERLREIKQGTAFQCHKTVAYGEDWEGRPGVRPQHCAGLMGAAARRRGQFDHASRGLFLLRDFAIRSGGARSRSPSPKDPDDRLRRDRHPSTVPASATLGECPLFTRERPACAEPSCHF
jgi:hypothetical protein